ncbi:MAG: hypothetical protein P8Y45_20625, partial [Exilibacterium sp.]
MQNLFYPLLLLLLIIPACVVQKGHLSAETDGKQALSLNPAAPPFSSIVWWRFKRLWNGNIRQEANQVREAELQPHPVHLRTLGSGQVELTWLGHSSTLLRVDGVTIL